MRIDHFVVVDFNGFRSMVDALGGVKVCVPEEVDDPTGDIHLAAGTYKVTGEQALDYVRVRHGISANGDIGRMKRQQTFIAAMIKKAISAGTLANPLRLYQFLNAATSSLTTDPGFARLKELARLGDVAEEHRPGQRPVPHRAVGALRARPQPRAARAHLDRAVEPGAQGPAARPGVHRTGGDRGRQRPGHEDGHRQAPWGASAAT